MSDYQTDDKSDANIEAFVAAGMIDDADALPEEAKEVLRALNEEEVQQLIKMWERIGRPDAEISTERELADFVFVP